MKNIAECWILVHRKLVIDFLRISQLSYSGDQSKCKWGKKTSLSPTHFPVSNSFADTGDSRIAWFSLTFWPYFWDGGFILGPEGTNKKKAGNVAEEFKSHLKSNEMDAHYMPQLPAFHQRSCGLPGGRFSVIYPCAWAHLSTGSNCKAVWVGFPTANRNHPCVMTHR